MSWQAFYSTIFLLGGIAELVLLGILLGRRQWKTFPVFTSYIAFNIFSDLVVSLQSVHPGRHAAEWTALAFLPAQYLLELGVLLEIAWQVVRPILPSLPRGALKLFAGLLGIAILGGLLLSARVNVHGPGIYDKVKIPLDLTVALLRMTIFAATAAFAQALGIGWRNKVLQLATALSLYSAVDLAASVVQSHWGQLDMLDHVRATAYLTELGLLIWAFTTKEVERREFKPEMRDFLITLSGRAREVYAQALQDQVK